MGPLLRPPLLVDTNILVDYLRGCEQVVRLIQKHADRIVVSSIVVAELYAGVKGPKELSVLDEFILLFKVVPVTPDIARSGGLLRNEYLSSHGLGLGDALIAATALSEDAELLTLNIKHYPMFKGLKPTY